MILSKENRSYIAEQIDAAIVAKGVLELIDGYAAKVVLNVIDNFADKKLTIADSVKEKLNSVVDAIKSNDIDTAETEISEVVDSLIDIPEIDDEDEKLIFEGAVKLVIGGLKTTITKIKTAA
jgi:hypothetical protein